MSTARTKRIASIVAATDQISMIEYGDLPMLHSTDSTFIYFMSSLIFTASSEMSMPVKVLTSAGA